MLKNVYKILIVFVIGMFGGIFASQILWPYFVEDYLFYQYRPDRIPVYPPEIKEIYIQENVALKDAIERAEKAVIRVKSETAAGRVLEGSGLILTSDGLIITLAELVPAGWEFSFYVNGQRVPYQVLKRDLAKNLALVKLEKTNLTSVGFARTERLKLGERVFLVGALPAGFAANEGIITSFNSDFVETNIFEKSTLAGSPLFDIEAKLLGLNTVGKDGRVVAVPISVIRDFSGL